MKAKAMSDKPPFDIEQFMQMQRAMQMLSPPAPAAPAAPAGAITGQGIRNWWPVIGGLVAALVAVMVWVVSGASTGTEKYTNMTNKLELHGHAIETKADRRDVEILERKVKDLTEEKADKREVIAIREKLDDLGKSNNEVRTLLVGVESKVSQLHSYINQGRGRVER
jgi:hypothetical protein